MVRERVWDKPKIQSLGASMPAEFETLSIESHADQVLAVTINRPQAANAMNTALGRDLLQVFSGIIADPASVRVVVLTGSGKGFCTGADLSGTRAAGPPGPGASREIMKGSSQRLMRALWERLPPERRGGYAETAAALEAELLANVRGGDIVMVKGSLGSRMGPIVKALERSYPRAEARAVASVQG